MRQRSVGINQRRVQCSIIFGYGLIRKRRIKTGRTEEFRGVEQAQPADSSIADLFAVYCDSAGACSGHATPTLSEILRYTDHSSFTSKFPFVSLFD